MTHAQIKKKKKKKKKVQYSPRVFFILHAHVVCTLTWVFSFLVFCCCFHGKFLGTIYMIKIQYSQHMSFLLHARAF